VESTGYERRPAVTGDEHPTFVKKKKIRAGGTRGGLVPKKTIHEGWYTRGALTGQWEKEVKNEDRQPSR